MTNVSKARLFECYHETGNRKCVGVEFYNGRIVHCLSDSGVWGCYRSGEQWQMCATQSKFEDLFNRFRYLDDTPAAEWLPAERLKDFVGKNVLLDRGQSSTMIGGRLEAASDDTLTVTVNGVTCWATSIKRFCEIQLPVDPPAPPKQPEIFRCKERPTNDGLPSKCDEQYQAVDWGDGYITVHGNGRYCEIRVLAWTYRPEEFEEQFERIEAAT